MTGQPASTYTVTFPIEALSRPPFGVWHRIDGGLEVMFRATDPAGTVHVRAAQVQPDGEADLPVRLVGVDAGVEFVSLEDAARDELMRLWDDLHCARGHAVRGCWSGECEDLARRIVALTRHVGATGWTQIQAPLIRSGLYERIHREAGLEYPPIDWERFDAYERRVQEGARLR